MSTQDCSDAIDLQFEDGEFIEECQEAEGNSSVKVPPMSSRKRPRDQEESSYRNKREKQDSEKQSSDTKTPYDCTAVIYELVRPCGIVKQAKGTSPPIEKCIVTLRGGRDDGCKAFLHRKDLFIYGKRMNKADFSDVINADDRLYVKLQFERQGRRGPKGKHAVDFKVVRAWLGSEPEKDKDGRIKESPLPCEGNTDRKAFMDYLKNHRLTEESFGFCYEGKQLKKPFFPLNKTKINKCFVSSLVSPPGEGEGATCGVIEVADGPLAHMLWGFDQMCLYICGVRVHCNDLNRLFLPADKVGPKDATYLTVEGSWKQSSEEAEFWDRRIAPALQKYDTHECKMMANIVYYGDRPKAPKKFDLPPSVEDILNNKPLLQWLQSQKMEPQFFHDLLQGVLPPLKQVIGNVGFIANKPLGSIPFKPLPLEFSTAPPPLMNNRPLSPLTVATEQFLNSPSKRRGTWPDGWADGEDRSRSKGRAFDRLGPPTNARDCGPRSRHASPSTRSDKTSRSPRRRIQSPEIRVLSPRKPQGTPKRTTADEEKSSVTNAPRVKLTSSAVGAGSDSSHVTGTLQRVERIVNGVLQCVSHDDPKVDTIITDKSDLQMAMFISKTLTTAIIRFNAGATLQKPPISSHGGMGNLPVSNVGVVKPMNMSGFAGPDALSSTNTGFFNNSKLGNFHQAWNMGTKGMEIGNYNGQVPNRDDMNGFRAAASAAGFHIR